MSNIKCPFCGQELNDNYYMCCKNPHCNKTLDMFGTEELWQELIRTRKALDIAVGALNSIVDYGKIACSELQKNALGQFQKPVSKMQDIAHLAVKQINKKEEK